MSKYKIFALFGKSGAGKDTIQKWIVSHNPDKYNSIVSMTTRPMREGEKEGVDYYFTDIQTFGAKILEGTMLEATEFNNWFYGTPIESLDKDKINIGVFNPAGLEALLENPELEIYPIYINASNKTRLLRCLNREENPDCEEICRRFIADEKDFTDLAIENNFDYFIIENNYEKINELSLDKTLKSIQDNF